MAKVNYAGTDFSTKPFKFTILSEMLSARSAFIIFEASFNIGGHKVCATQMGDVKVDVLLPQDARFAVYMAEAESRNWPAKLIAQICEDQLAAKSASDDALLEEAAS